MLYKTKISGKLCNITIVKERNRCGYGYDFVSWSGFRLLNIASSLEDAQERVIEHLGSGYANGDGVKYSREDIVFEAVA